MNPKDEYIIYVIDTETTGLDPEQNDIIEFSANRFYLSDISATEQMTWYLKAMNPLTVDEAALNVNKHKKEDILHLTKVGKEKYKNPKEAILEIENWINDDGMSSLDRIFAGHNPLFDINFLKSLWNKNGTLDTFPFVLDKNERIIDTKQLALFVDLCTGKRRQFYNLGSLVKNFSIRKTTAHTALGDVQMTTDLLTKILQNISPLMLEKFKDCY